MYYVLLPKASGGEKSGKIMVFHFLDLFKTFIFNIFEVHIPLQELRSPDNLSTI